MTNFFFSFLFLIFLKGVLLNFYGGGSAPTGFGGGGRFFFFLISGRGVPPVGFGGRGDFVSRLGAGGEEKTGYPKGLASIAFVFGVLLRLRRPRALG